MKKDNIGKILIVVLCVFATYKMNAQSAKSDSLFAIGVDLYNAGKYQEAISIFEESDKLDKTELDSTSNRRNYSAMWLASCYYQLGDSIKANSLYIYYDEKPVDRRLTVKPDSLLHLADEYYDQHDYQNVLNLYNKALEIEKTIVGENHPLYINTISICYRLEAVLQNYQNAIQLCSKVIHLREKLSRREKTKDASLLLELASFYSLTGNNHEAIQISTEAMLLYEKFGKDKEGYAKSLLKISNYYRVLGNYKDAIQFGEKAIHLYKNLKNEDSNYAESLLNLSDSYSELGNYSKAIQFVKEALQLYEKNYGRNNLRYAISLSKLADYYSKFGKYEEAIQLGKNTIQLAEIISGKESSLYALSLSNLATYYLYAGNYSEVIRLGIEAAQIYKKYFGSEHHYYATSLSNLAEYYSTMGNNPEAIRLSMEALQIKEKNFGKNHSSYVRGLCNLAKYYSFLGNYTEAIQYTKEAMQIIERVIGKENSDYAMSLNNLSLYYSEIGNYKEAIVFVLEAIQIYEKVSGRENHDYLTALSNLANYHSKNGNYADAIRIGTEVVEISKVTFGTETSIYAEYLNNLIVFHSMIGDTTKAISLGMEMSRICEKIYGKEHPSYATIIDNLSVNYFISGNYSDAIRLTKEALQIREKLFGKDHPDYIQSLNNLATCYYCLSNDSLAIQLLTEAMQIIESHYGKEHPDYINTLNNLSTCYYSMGNYTNAIMLSIESMNICEKVYGKESPYYLKCVERLSMSYYQINRYVESATYTIETSKRYESLIMNNFKGLISFERNSIWNLYNSWYYKNIHQLAFKYHMSPVVENAINGVLLSKGIILNSEIELERILTENNDGKIKDLFLELQNYNKQLKLHYEESKTEQIINIDSLQKKVRQLERQLVEKSKKYGDYTKNLRIKWEDVQTKLMQKDLSIEFVSFPLTNDSTMYIAYVLKKDMASPVMVPLFEEKQLKKEEWLYNNTSVSKLVWEPLAKYLEGVQNVYFAPSGELYNIGIEYLPHWNGEGRMSEKWNMYRLSSTRQLAVVKDKNALKQASVYGGVKYDTKEDLLVADSRKYRSQERSFNYEPFVIADSLGLRAGASYLPATKVEAEEIDKTLEQKKITTKLLIDTLATEGAFKDLSGKKTNLLHIATHGFYWTETEAKYKDNLNFLMLNDNQPKYVEDKALTRSGLLLAGANHALKGKKLPEGVDDGILTAKEISQLDLRGLDLVVLSACETGLGEIKGDGVFGLQRGFKKAGANSLLMSLWKVDDNATQLLMTQFYKNLTSGMSKFESLRQAQKYVRDYEVEVEVKSDNRPSFSAHAKEQAKLNANKEKAFKKVKKYENPKYWAAFILLDAID